MTTGRLASRFTHDPRISTGYGETGSYKLDSESDSDSDFAEMVNSVQTMTNAIGLMHQDIALRPIRSNTTLYDLGDAEYELSTTLQITIDEYQDEENFVASFPQLELIGEGKSPSVAVSNLQDEILDLYDELIDMPENTLGALMLSWRRILNRIVSKK